jgi:hypothetical protein
MASPIPIPTATKPQAILLLAWACAFYNVFPTRDDFILVQFHSQPET